ncbi:MAG: 4Fe-4S ferredoxin iron-sulfur binding domain protein, partial [Bacillota bacterium]|nr:4Fe-4S ferredoxin iron-sulfur binding domain protein [Bacillota bacterium]
MANKKNLVTNVDWCKGCSVCVAFCPKQVLKIENEKIVIAEREKCISCGMCELRCPDNA